MPDDSVSRDVASPKVCGKSSEDEEQAAKDEMITEGNLEETSEKESLFDRVRPITSGPDIEKLVSQILKCGINSSEPFSTLPEANTETAGSEAEYDEGTDHTIQLELNLPESFPEQCAELEPEAPKNVYVDGKIVSKQEKDNLFSELAEVDVKLLVTDLEDLWKATSPSKTGANIDVVRCPISEEVNPDEYDECEQRIPSEFERACREWKFVSCGKASDLLPETEASYLTLSHKNVKHLKIINPSYNLSSKDYKPQVAIVDNRYRIIIDVSPFDPGNIVVHLVGDRINVYARGNLVDENSYTSTDLHKVCKVPEGVNKDEFEAHMLNPLKLLCICAPLKLSMQDQNAACTPMEM